MEDQEITLGELAERLQVICDQAGQGPEADATRRRLQEVKRVLQNRPTLTVPTTGVSPITVKLPRFGPECGPQVYEPPREPSRSR